MTAASSHRRDAEGETKFQTVFWCVPTGVGRTRFVLGTVGPFAPPRGLSSIPINQFLDEDTYLLATQQSHYLPLEAAAAREGTPFRRRDAYRYTSQNDASLARLGRFFDRHLPSAPNRAVMLAALCPPTAPGVSPPPLATPAREYVLDRWAQHTAITPSSLAYYRGMRALAVVFTLSGVITATLYLWKCCFPVLKCLANPWSSETLWAVFTESFWTDVVLLAMVCGFTAAAMAAVRAAQAFTFQKTADSARADLDRIPNVYSDTRHRADA